MRYLNEATPRTDSGASTAYHEVVFDEGALKRQWMTTFVVTRPPPPPPAP